MGDRMTPIPFGNLMNWAMTEARKAAGPYLAFAKSIKQIRRNVFLFSERRLRHRTDRRQDQTHSLHRIS